MEAHWLEWQTNRAIVRHRRKPERIAEDIVHLNVFYAQYVSNRLDRTSSRDIRKAGTWLFGG